MTMDLAVAVVSDNLDMDMEDLDRYEMAGRISRGELTVVGVYVMHRCPHCDEEHGYHPGRSSVWQIIIPPMRGFDRWDEPIVDLDLIPDEHVREIAREVLEDERRATSPDEAKQVGAG